MFAEIRTDFFHAAKFYTKLQKKIGIPIARIEKTAILSSYFPTSSIITGKTPKIFSDQGKNP